MSDTSESTPENESRQSPDTSEEGIITDDQLPDDLNPEKNPLAREPDDTEDAGISADGGDPGRPA